MTAQTILTVTGGVFAVLVVICLVATLYYLIRRRTFTRERFAFTAFSGCATGFALMVTAIMASTTPLQQLLGLIEYIKTGQLPVQSPLSPLTSALLVLIYGMLCGLAFFIFKHWDGARSKNDHFASEANKEVNMFK
ncbi:MAG: hypothetical protein ACI8WB_005611, partial [Phenylobacterium sp.]